MQLRRLHRLDVDDLGRGYPRPQFQRDSWFSLSGPWKFALDPDMQWQRPADLQATSTITVPFSPEAPLSGIGENGYFDSCWYQVSINVPERDDGELLILHFGAVDYEAEVWLGDRRLGSHEGGYTPFWFDITELAPSGSVQELTVRAVDDPGDLERPRGKQDWELHPHAIWYPRTSGIWQTVWLEHVPRAHLKSAAFTARMERWEIQADLCIERDHRTELFVSMRVSLGDKILVEDRYLLLGEELDRGLSLPDPGIDDARNALLWSPESPTLLDVRIELQDAEGHVIESIASYTALRSVSVEGDRFMLNHRPYPLRLVLDQGYWPSGGLTAPDDEALRRDVELARALGFNGVRKHQKVEDPRYLHWADRLGLVVWVEMPSAYRFTRRAVQRVTREWTKVLERDYSHPCVIAWVPLNESWGVPNLPQNSWERHYVQALYHLTRSLDPGRLVIGNDGWESVATDIVGVHDYEDALALTTRYRPSEGLERRFEGDRPGGRMLMLQDHPVGLPVVLSEFGGISLESEEDDRSWGYFRVRDTDRLLQLYTEMLQAVHDLPLLSGFCYTQFADTYQETNGLLFPDRRPKMPMEDVARATRGRLPPWLRSLYASRKRED